MISPGFTHTELAEGIGDNDIRAAVSESMSTAIPATAIGAAIEYAISQPPEVDVNEIIVRPTVQG